MGFFLQLMDPLRVWEGRRKVGEVIADERRRQPLRMDEIRSCFRIPLSSLQVQNQIGQHDSSSNNKHT